MMTRPTNSLVISKLGATRAAQERPYKPKRSLVDFDESDESIVIEEEDEFDAELSRLLIDKHSFFNLQLPAGKEKSHLWMRARRSLELVEDMEALISKILDAG